MLHSNKHKHETGHSNRPSRWLVGSVSLVLVFLVGFGMFIWNHRQSSRSPAQASSQQNTQQVHDPLTGLLVDQVHPNQQIYGVMIDEHVDAQPQSGIDQAFLVIEAPVEAGIPRLLVFFSQDQSVPKIGPVRSARPYFIDWANELGALYVHVGGSNEALEKIASGATFDLNQFWHDPQFWRSIDRSAPHNVYTSTDLLSAYVQKKQEVGNVQSPLYGVWKYKTEDPKQVFPQRFGVKYVSPDYAYSWGYDVEQKTYVRLLNGQPQKTLDGQEIHEANVIVMLTDVEVVDAVGRRHVRTTGKGKAFVFQDGKQMEVVWKKPAESERLRFYTKDGQELEMNPGHSWIEVIEDESQLTVQP